MHIAPFNPEQGEGVWRIPHGNYSATSARDYIALSGMGASTTANKTTALAASLEHGLGGVAQTVNNGGLLLSACLIKP